MGSQAIDYRKVLSKLRKDKDYIVWWYGRVTLKARREPQVEVLFKESVNAKSFIGK